MLAIFLTVFRAVVIPVQFQDTEFTYGQEDLHQVIDKASQYLDTQFRGSMTFEFTLASPVTLSHKRVWYGANAKDIHDQHIPDAVVEACRASDEEIDFSTLDGDGDGKIDCVVLLTAGMSESDGAGSDSIWPQQGFLSGTQSELELDGVTADPFITITELKSDYGIKPRLCGIGDLCHELMHIFGVPDFYDTDGEASGLGKGLWKSLSLMDYGNRNDGGRTPPNFSAVEMDMLSLGKCDTVSAGRYTLSPIDRDGRYLKILSPLEGEYFLLECREASGWDKHIGGEGLLVYHIDRSEPDYSAFWETNRVNAVADRQGACILAAPETSDVSEVFFPRPGRTSITSDSSPALAFHDGMTSSFAISGISRTESGEVSFNVSEPVVIKEINAFQDAAIISWILGGGAAKGNTTITWYRGDEELGSETVFGADTHTIEHLKPGTSYRVRLSVNTVEGDVCSFTARFKTKAFMDDIKPYIYLRSADRGPDGSFLRGARIPLRIFNVIDAEETEWTFDGLPAVTGPDGFFTVEKSGRLKAKVYHSDGSMDIIIKDIVVK